MDFVLQKSERGESKILEYNQFQYWKHRINSDKTTTWRCKSHRIFKCRARVKTRGDKITGDHCPIHTHDNYLTQNLGRRKNSFKDDSEITPLSQMEKPSELTITDLPLNNDFILAPISENKFSDTKNDTNAEFSNHSGALNRSAESTDLRDKVKAHLTFENLSTQQIQMMNGIIKDALFSCLDDEEKEQIYLNVINLCQAEDSETNTNSHREKRKRTPSKKSWKRLKQQPTRKANNKSQTEKSHRAKITTNREK